MAAISAAAMRGKNTLEGAGMKVRIGIDVGGTFTDAVRSMMNI